jgi:hypothetical protein
MDKNTLETEINNNIIKPFVNFFTLKRKNIIIGCFSVITGVYFSFYELSQLMMHFRMADGMVYLVPPDPLPDIISRLIISILLSICGLLLIPKKQQAIRLYNIFLISFLLNITYFYLNACIEKEKIILSFGIALFLIIPMVFIFILLNYFRKKKVLEYYNIITVPGLIEYLKISIWALIINFLPLLIFPRYLY